MLKFLLPLVVLLALGCSSEGDIKIINRTDHNLYFTIQGVDYILEGSQTTDPVQKITVDTGKQFLFWGEEETKVHVALQGETFMMQDADQNGYPNGIYFTETNLYVKPDETTKVFCDPTHAGVKLINNSNLAVDEFSYFTDDNDSLRIMNEVPIFSGEEFWARLKATTDYDSIVYSFVIEFDNGIIDSSYADIDFLSLDEQLLIELQ
jgi:hypothetical protein